MDGIYLGIDVGSTTVKVVVLDAQKNLLAHRYQRGLGQPRATLLRIVDELAQETPLEPLLGVGLTGSGGEPVANIIGGRHVNELIAQTRSANEYNPFARTIIEIGGQDSKFLALEWNESSQSLMLADFAMNAVCAAGTGAFLDQQAERLGIAIDGEFGRLACESTTPARIAGRCTVFAKSDMIHLQQRGTPVPDVLAGLCLALARNFRSVIGKGKAFVPPILFQGGVAYNAGVVRAFETVLELPPGGVIVPNNHHIMAALGTALNAMDERAEGQLPAFLGFERLRDGRTDGHEQARHRPPLRQTWPVAVSSNGHGRPVWDLVPTVPVAVGIDVGSISTNVVAIDRQGQVLARRYLPTAGRPLDAVRQGLAEVGVELGAGARVETVGVTGSGRYLTADFVGADVVRNEITAQTRAAIAIDPTVDTIFEIGGQDSKFIRVSNGAIVDFAMNSACAAGTGSFLEEQADRLSIDLKRDFSQLARQSACPAGLGERCTVFMESDLVHHQQRGAQVDDLVAGLAYSIAENYLNRVVNARPIGYNIFFQGGVASNQSVVAAFRSATGRSITVPPHHDVTGAIGVALLALEERARQPDPRPTAFKGFDLAERHYETTIFECQACPNLCEVSKIVIAGEPPIFHGARCDRFEEAGRGRGHVARTVPDLYAERMTWLMGDWEPPATRSRRRVALPRALSLYDLFPYWRAFFGALDYDIILSEPTNPSITRFAIGHATTEICYPAKLMYGHVASLLEADADLIFLPAVIDRETVAPGQRWSNYCPVIPATSYLVPSALRKAPGAERILAFPLFLRDPKARSLHLNAIAGRLGVTKKQIAAADAAGLAAQAAFVARQRARGQAVLAGLSADRPGVVLVGRPYNIGDASVCQDVPYKLRRLGVLPIPIDFLPLDDIDVSDRYEQMDWYCGQHILAAGRLIRDDPRLNAIYVTNFGCGPDSFLLSHFRTIMDPKPFLELEIDEHTADAGIVTRCEAFLESLSMAKGIVA